MLCQFALQVGSLVLGDGLFGGKAVEQRAYFAVASFGSSLVGNFTDKDGNKRKSVQVVANNVSFCGSKAESGTTSNPVFSQPAPSYASADNSDFEEISDDDDDLPF